MDPTAAFKAAGIPIPSASERVQQRAKGTRPGLPAGPHGLAPGTGTALDKTGDAARYAWENSGAGDLWHRFVEHERRVWSPDRDPSKSQTLRPTPTPSPRVSSDLGHGQGAAHATTVNLVVDGKVLATAVHRAGTQKKSAR
jgi:hypothetical protein